jgi:DNA-binding IclR family transcriptional regulator
VTGTDTEVDVAQTSAPSNATRTLRVLLAFSEYRPTATIKELAEAINAPVSTVYRHVRLLREVQLIEEGSPGRYHPTAKVAPVARAAQLANGIDRIAQPIVRAMCEELGESILLMQDFGDSIVCVGGMESSNRIRFTVETGHSMRDGQGASGRMVLAMLPPTERAARLTRIDADPHLRALVDQAAELRFATSEGEVDVGTWACAVPISLVNNRPVALTLAGPAARIPASKREAIILRLQESAGQIASRFRAYSY